MALYTIHHKGIKAHFETFESNEEFENVVQELLARFDFPIDILPEGFENEYETHCYLD